MAHGLCRFIRCPGAHHEILKLLPSSGVGDNEGKDEACQRAGWRAWQMGKHSVEHVPPVWLMCASIGSAALAVPAASHTQVPLPLHPTTQQTSPFITANVTAKTNMIKIQVWRGRGTGPKCVARLRGNQAAAVHAASHQRLWPGYWRVRTVTETDLHASRQVSELSKRCEGSRTGGSPR